MSQLIAMLQNQGGSGIGIGGSQSGPGIGGNAPQSSIANTLYNLAQQSGTPGSSGMSYGNIPSASNPYAVPTVATSPSGGYYSGTRAQ